MKAAFIVLIFFTMCTRINNSPQAVSAQDKSMQNKTNIIMIMLDDVGYELPRYTGGQSYETPNLDFLAANGKQFPFMFACPMCSPSRQQLHTGKYNNRNYHYWGVLDSTEPTIAQKLKAAGYKTCVAGKWQLDGGDQAIHHAGFEKYCVGEPFVHTTEANKYKNPEIYQDAGYLPASFTDGKYGDDIFLQYIFDFIDSNKSKQFFVNWNMNLIHVPHQPTPDDPEFATYDPEQSSNIGEIKYYPSMIKYMDKLIGLLVNKLYQTGLLENTVILIAGDNGSSNLARSRWNGQWINGTKGETILTGIHVPFVAYWLGTVMPSIDNSLVDFSDFMPTILDIAGVTNTTFTDGKTFYPQLVGQTNPSPRKWVYCWFKPNLHSELISFVMDWKYKKYDSGTAHKDSLINYQANPKNERGIINLNKQMKIIDSIFNTVLKSMH